MKNSMRFIMVFVRTTVEVGDSVCAVPESKRRWKNLKVSRLKIGGTGVRQFDSPVDQSWSVA